jgi:type IV pilus assembly protein PilA
MRKKQGFTLIELMIVVAIIGILAAIGAQIYIDYARRALVSEGLTLASGAKTSVTEYYSSKNSLPADNPSAGLSTTISGNAVSSITVESGQIIIVYNDKTGASGDTIILSPDTSSGSVKWSCTGGTIRTTLRPSACRS